MYQLKQLRLMILLFGWNICAQMPIDDHQSLVYRIREDKINTSAQQYKEEMKRHWFLQQVLIIGAPTLQLYMFWKMVVAAKGNSNVQKDFDIEELNYVEKPESIGFMNGVKTVPGLITGSIGSAFSAMLDFPSYIGRSLLDLGGALQKPETWIYGTMGLGKLVGNAAMHIGIQLMLHKLTQIYVHDHTVTWVIKTRADYKHAIEEIKNCIHYLTTERDTLEPEEKKFFEQTLTSALETLRDHIENILAFMTYKSALLSKKNAREARAIVTYLKSYTDKFSHQFESLLAQPYTSEENYCALFNSLETHFEAQIMHYRRLDADEGPIRKTKRQPTLV